MRIKYWVLSIAAILAVLTTTPATATSPSCGNRADLGPGPRLTILALTMDQRLVQFQECNPDRLKEIGAVILQSPDTALVGIDFRVQDGLLYGVGNGGGIYTINTSTAVASLASQLSMGVSLLGSFFGVDFNPAADRLRIISDNGQNLAHDLNTGVTAVNTTLNYPAPVNINPATGVTGAAYTNNDLSGTTGTTLFDVDTVLNQVAIQSPPGQGELVAVGSLTVDPNTPAGFDIYTDLRKNVAFKNRGFASLFLGSMSGFYRVNLLTGQATSIGTFSDPVIDIAIPLNQ